MIITYTPEGSEPQTFDAARLRASEIQIIERTVEGHWSEIKRAMGNGDINAMRTVAWVIKKRQEPSLRFAQFDPWEGELRVRLDEREVKVYAQNIFERYAADPEELAEAFEELRESAHDRETAEAAIADVTAPKDPAPAEEPQSPASPTE
ncbi:hypothetical protein [Streptomyces chartreusis]|uniref:hypothetical protein n=1 Tax=Streptomyces chartreusis TaxID=1969 RepID=UPI0036318393